MICDGSDFGFTRPAARLMGLFLMGIFVVMAGSFCVAGIDAGLVAHYPLEGDLTDASGYGRHGTYVNGAWSYEPGVLGQALKLPGTADARITFSPWVPGAGSFTVAGWFHIADPSELWMNYRAEILTEQNGDFSHGFVFRVAKQQGVFSLQFAICANYNSTTWANSPAIAPEELFGRWHHAAAVVDRAAGVVRLYMNGQQVDTSALVTGAIYPTKGLLGSYDYLYPRNGATRFVSPANRLDDVRLYNRALYGEEVADLYDLGVNEAPIAIAGVDQSVVAGDTVALDGSLSWDPDGDDPLLYNWEIVSGPEGSLAALDRPDAVDPSFVADLPGEYVVRLVVSDGLAESLPSLVTVTAVSVQDEIARLLQEAMAAIAALDPADFKNKNMAGPLTRKIEEVLVMVAQARYGEALDKLQHDVLAKMDGCAASGAPDANDWLVTCASQESVYPLVNRAAALLETLAAPAGPLW